MTTQRKRPISIRSEINVEANSIRFWAFDHVQEKEVNGLGFRVDAGKVNPKLHRYAILDGIKDSIRDAGALGIGATLGAKFKAMQERADWLTSGTDSWTKDRGPRESSDMVLLVKALCRQDASRDAEKIRSVVVNWTRDKVAAMLRDERLADIVAELRAEEGTGVDTDKLFEELG